MSASVATLNILLGLVYLGIGGLTLYELIRDRHRGFTHFGTAFVLLALTCGPHHLVHGVHVALEGRTGGVLDSIAVLFGLPAGVAWVALRLEAVRGGAGDRLLHGMPRWLVVLPTAGAIYVTIVIATMIRTAGTLSSEYLPLVIANLLLVGLYIGVAYYLIRTQLANRRSIGGWSVSGLGLAGIFSSCAVMHAVYAYYGLTGLYDVDLHGIVADWVSVPGTAYFLWVVHGLYSGAFRDWNGAPSSGAVAAGPA